MLFSILLNISIISLSLSYIHNKKCIKVSCGLPALENGKCVAMIEDNFAMMSTCPSGKYCLLNSDELEDSYCNLTREIEIKGFPGMKCESFYDCLHGSCIDKKCQVIELNQNCNFIEECEYGLTCRPSEQDPNQKTCRKPLQGGETCIKDTDCNITHGCFHSKCVPYFSLEDNSIIDEPIEYPQLSLCKSGYSDSKGKCLTLHLNGNNIKCDDAHPCRYGSDTVIPENCKCGYNSDGDKYCLIGSGHYNYTRYVNYLKDYYFSKGKCHLAERGGNGCLMDIKEGDNAIKETIQKLYNFKMWALYNNKLILPSDKCVFQIELPQYDPTKDEVEIQPELAKCATYQCLENQSFCAQSKYTSISKIEVTLSETCNESNYCSVGGKPNDIFYHGTDITGECKDNSIQSAARRYPGEDCSIDTDCINPKESPSLGKCVENKCTGIIEGGSCKLTETCMTGFYCNSISEKCTPQVDLNGECKSSFDCKNKLLCYEGLCKDMIYTQEPGIVLEKADPKTYQYYCKFGVVSEKTCVKYVERNKSSKNAYTPCEIKDRCEYQYEPASFGVMNKDCGCGYNSKGQGYCPLGQESDENGWKYYYQALKEQYDNNCHSVNRFNCHLTAIGVKNKISKYTNRVIDGHLFHEAVKCAEKILSSHRFSLSFITLLLISLFTML